MTQLLLVESPSRIPGEVPLFVAVGRVPFGVTDEQQPSAAPFDQQHHAGVVDDLALFLGFSVADVRDGSIWALFVRPDSEGRGIGRTLLGMACDWLFAQGHPKISLSTGIGTRADRFYAAHGWQRELRPGDREASYTLSAGERHQA